MKQSNNLLSRNNNQNKRNKTMDNEKLKIKSELAAKIFESLLRAEPDIEEERVCDEVIRLTNAITKGIEYETGYTKVHLQESQKS